MTTPANPAHGCEGHVHFDDECVLIPDPVAQSRMPRLVKKSYSLPLWKKRSGSQQPMSDGEQDCAIAASPPKDTMTITVPLPSFARSRSPTRSEYQHQPLVSCMVHAGHHSPRQFVRRPSLPLPPRPDAVIVPLRPCCEECYRITEQCLREGDHWQEKFTRGARRRRNSSADACQHLHAQRHRTVRQDLPGFGAIVSVDEVDRRHGISRTANSASKLNADDSDEEALAPSLSRSKVSDTPMTPPPAAIGEVEEEDDEFPFPSPSASTSRAPLTAGHQAHASSSPVLSEALADANQLSEHLESLHAIQDDNDPNARNRETVYYTPDTSPTLEADEPSLIRSSPSTFTEKDDIVFIESPKTAPTTHSHTHSQTAAITIPSTSEHQHHQHHHHKAWFSDFTLSTLDILHDSSNLIHPRSSHYSTSTASPELTDYVPTLVASSTSTSTSASSPRKRTFLQSLPSPSSFLRVGSDVLKGMAAPGTVSGTCV